MIRRCVSVFVLLLGVMAVGLAGIAQQPATEAPASAKTTLDVIDIQRNLGRCRCFGRRLSSIGHSVSR